MFNVQLVLTIYRHIANGRDDPGMFDRNLPKIQAAKKVMGSPRNSSDCFGR